MCAKYLEHGSLLAQELEQRQKEKLKEKEKEKKRRAKLRKKAEKDRVAEEARQQKVRFFLVCILFAVPHVMFAQLFFQEEVNTSHYNRNLFSVVPK